MYANKIPKDVKIWMKEHNFSDLEIDYFNSGSEYNTKIQEILNLLYDLGLYEDFEVNEPVKAVA
ncbi:MAG: hypothetical protein ACP5NL_00730 [Thermoplasmata archaeon]